MILNIFLVVFAISNISFDSFKEIDLKEELVSQPKFYKNQVFLFSGKKVFRLTLDKLSISTFFEGYDFTVSEKGIIYQRNGAKILFTFEGEELNVDETGQENFHEIFQLKFKKIFSDSEYLFAQTEDNSLYCIRKKDLKKKWKIKGPSEVMALISDMKRVYILFGSDLVFCLKRKGGDIIWWKSMKERCFPFINIFEDNLILSSRDGVHFLNTKDGAMSGRLSVSMDFAPILYGEFLIFFKTDKIIIYKVKR